MTGGPRTSERALRGVWLCVDLLGVAVACLAMVQARLWLDGLGWAGVPPLAVRVHLALAWAAIPLWATWLHLRVPVVGAPDAGAASLLFRSAQAGAEAVLLSVAGLFAAHAIAPVSRLFLFGFAGAAVAVCAAWRLAWRATLHAERESFGDRVSDPQGFTAKRLVDVVVSGAALVLLTPVFAAIALAVRRGDGGPVFFAQQRVGLDGRRFQVLKFRSMDVGAHHRLDDVRALNEMDGPVFKSSRDPRVTPIGRWLRRYSLDELPQLVNVLRGEMSLVGPRPALPEEVTRYEPWQRRRLAMRPGLTCSWQVSDRQMSFADWMRLDLSYIDRWSLGLDLRLLVRTVPFVLFGRGHA